MQIFISYSRADVGRVEELTADLEALGHRVWYDGELRGGVEWWKAILKSIRECDLTILVVSPSWIASQACDREHDYAVALKKPVIPVLVSGSPALLPSDLRGTQLVTYGEDVRSGLRGLARALVAHAPPHYESQIPADFDPTTVPEPPVPVSDISALRDRVESAILAPDQQRTSLQELVAYFGSRHEHDAREVVAMLRQRADLIVEVAEAIDLLPTKKARKSGRPEHRRLALTGLAYSAVAWILGAATMAATQDKQAASAVSIAVLVFGGYRLVRSYRGR